jgi:8-oxo-dGTP pyrophosphatase MutT (NUDIX family)
MVDDAGLEYTWDGLPVAPDNPRGAMVVVRRPDGDGGREYLMLHRAHRGPDYEGDWAWTPPSGARLPGEPVLTGARRELAEEAGLDTPGLAPVDLSGGWAVLAAEVGAGEVARLDAEHDALCWLPLAEALRRCQPAAPAANLRAGAAVPLPAIAFRPLRRGDLPAPVDWPHAPVDVMLVDGRACGFIQHYRATDGGLDAAGLDYGIGVSSLTGRGLGPQILWKYLEQVVFPAWPLVPFVVASPAVDNHRSIRALEKAGFTQAREIPGPRGGRDMLCVLDRQRIFGMPPPAGPAA